MKLKRFEGNPILKPTKNHWEEFIYNPGAIFLEDRVHIIYRAMGRDKISRFGYASSKDGFNIDERLDHPIFIPKGEAEEPAVKLRCSGVEDPRLVKIGDEIYMIYAAVDGRAAHTSLASIKVKDFLNQNWKWKRHGVIFPHCDSRDSIIFPEKIKGNFVLHIRFIPNIYVSYSKDLKNWSKPKLLMTPRKNMWDCLKIGDNSIPILTEKGWLVIYHGVEPTTTGKRYGVGFYMIDKEDPEKILFRTEKPILEPEEDYEKFGQVNDVVFPGSAIVLEDTLFIYYGGADSVVGVATAKLSEFLREVS